VQNGAASMDRIGRFSVEIQRLKYLGEKLFKDASCKTERATTVVLLSASTVGSFTESIYVIATFLLDSEGSNCSRRLPKASSSCQ
jgi:hypothetical protein